MGSAAPSMFHPRRKDVDIEAAEDLLHVARSNGSQPIKGPPTTSIPTYGPPPAQVPHPPLPIQTAAYPHFTQPFSPPGGPNQHRVYDPISEQRLPLQHDARAPDPSATLPYSQLHEPTSFNGSHQSSHSNAMQHEAPQRNTSFDATSPRGSGERARSDGWNHRSSNDAGSQINVKDEPDFKPSWAFEKTKAGKERKRLPLACIACRRKKIRCSGEKPNCKHCTRARMPCVYKVTTRKAAPRTDYMAMLDRRLKRMEERVIKIIPKEDSYKASDVPRATVKPPISKHVSGSKKRGLEEAFGGQGDEWTKAKFKPPKSKSDSLEEDGKNIMEGAVHLPSVELQEHLSEVFFDQVYGQAYFLMHKPSYFRKLRAGTLPPVIVLTVCAVSARFSTHPQVNSEPAYLRGDEWAAPARELVLKRYDEPNISTLTATVILGLHEFGTCQGGRSWMFAGMATRMAHALQLHRDLDRYPLGRKSNDKNEFSSTDREIRRRTMWACFSMDRFTSSGTERPALCNEDAIKVQLPIREDKFQMEIPAITENLAGEVYNDKMTNSSQPSDPRENMGVAAYMILSIALYGRVIKYLNMGGKSKDPCPAWELTSHWADLKRQALEFKASFPPELHNTKENLQNHAAQQLASQFIFLHVTSNQIILFLHRFAVPTSPGGRAPSEMPKAFFNDSYQTAMDSANKISTLLACAEEYSVNAPFMGYCAFSSSTVHIWAVFSGTAATKATSSKHLADNVKYLRKMRKYWGLFHFMADNLKEIYLRHSDRNQDRTKEEAAIFQFGDWFDRYPHGVTHASIDQAGTKVKKEPNEDETLSQKSDLQKVADFFETLSPPTKSAQVRKQKRAPKMASSGNKRSSQPQITNPQLENTEQVHPVPISIPDAQASMTPSQFTPSNPMFQTAGTPYSTPTDLMQFPNQALLPQLDRQIVWNAYNGQHPASSTSASALNANSPSMFNSVNPGEMWDASPPMDMSQEPMMMGVNGDDYMNDPNTGAWFMPFNVPPPGGYNAPG
ncbi:uncharacterized protein KY384_000970 [Bacidia gigantensis]|uniref:uncharacterized protein n=1 Tax=Bacidia gigantensis TaxID=2732470 RepID=UPI001D03E6E1|nr:uncharacterized protein KY384_000970 [Bacidia gigantensis]KAG8534126.1 hypothetical protein KY384_000970 [Bacidia gigantensis]